MVKTTLIAFTSVELGASLETFAKYVSGRLPFAVVTGNAEPVMLIATVPLVTQPLIFRAMLFAPEKLS